MVSEILGHATTAMTLDTYTHVHDPLMRSALDRLTAHLTVKLTADPPQPRATRGNGVQRKRVAV